jgi:hypothetical protein
MTMNDNICTVVLLSLFSQAEPNVLRDSKSTVHLCSYEGDNGLVVVKAQQILSVVAMVPDWNNKNPETEEHQFFVVEQPGIKSGTINPQENLEDSEDEGDEDEDDMYL